MSPITSISTCTKRLSAAQRSISATDFSTLCAGITIEPRSRASLSSHCLASQSFSARQDARVAFAKPFPSQPVVQRAAERIRHVLAVHHLHAVERIADAVTHLERIERLRLHVGAP